MTPTLSHPAAVMERLEAIERDLAVRELALEAAALAWFRLKRDREHAWAVEFLKTSGTVAERKAVADQQTALMGVAEEAEYEALRAVVRVLETRATIGMALLKTQGRS